MRLNVYSQELITSDYDTWFDKVGVVEKTSNTGLTYTGVQLFLHSYDGLHHPPKDDDRSAITF